MRFQVLTVVMINFQFLWNVTECRLVIFTNVSKSPNVSTLCHSAEEGTAFVLNAVTTSTY